MKTAFTLPTFTSIIEDSLFRFHISFLCSIEKINILVVLPHALKEFVEMYIPNLDSLHIYTPFLSSFPLEFEYTLSSLNHENRIEETILTKM